MYDFPDDEKTTRLGIRNYSDLNSGTETELNKLIRNYARELNKIAKCRNVKQRYTKGHTKEWNQPLQLNEERIKKRQKKLQSGRNICI